MKFLEIEHKYLVNDQFDQNQFRERVGELNPLRVSNHTVVDRYYFLQDRPEHIYRFRLDDEIQQLTAKSYGRENEVRLEVNIDLGLMYGDQTDAIEAFLETIGIAWEGSIKKNVEVFEFADCEVVFYEAFAKDKKFRCVEIEAKSATDQIEAIAILKRYENKLGFETRLRCKQNLFDLCFGQ